MYSLCTHMYSFFVYTYVDLLGFWNEAPAAKRFPGYYRGLRERWIRESGCYFFYHMSKKWGYGTPTPKGGGYAYPPYPP